MVRINPTTYHEDERPDYYGDSDSGPVFDTCTCVEIRGATWYDPPEDDSSQCWFHSDVRDDHAALCVGWGADFCKQHGIDPATGVPLPGSEHDGQWDENGPGEMPW